jgi:hypothetical protein
MRLSSQLASPLKRTGAISPGINYGAGGAMHRGLNTLRLAGVDRLDAHTPFPGIKMAGLKAHVP